MSDQHDPFSVTKRKSFGPKERMRIFQMNDGICWMCKLPIDRLHERWIAEHIQPLALDGTNDDSNLGVTHEKCAKLKTAKEAVDRAKGRRIAAKHFGAKKSKRPMMGSRASGWKRKMNGSVVRRK